MKGPDLSNSVARWEIFVNGILGRTGAVDHTTASQGGFHMNADGREISPSFSDAWRGSITAVCLQSRQTQAAV